MRFSIVPTVMNTCDYELTFYKRTQNAASHLLMLSLCLAFTAGSASAANLVTFYRDGALFRQEAGAVKGTIDIPLADNVLEHTLTIVPASGTTIIGVETDKTGSGTGGDKEFETWTEQRRRLEDRLQALETREAIFTAAAKTQSGKAPRKTKANPDPLQAIRQGTDFAIAQLEAVYTSRRKTLQEIQKIDARLATAGKRNRPADKTLHIAVTPPRGAVILRYATSECGWQPRYNLYLTGDGTVKAQLSAKITEGGRGYQVRVSPGSLTESGSAETFPVQAGSVVLATYSFPLSETRSIEGIFNSFSGKMTNSSAHYLPPGDSVLFRGGAYIGRSRFAGFSSGRSVVISLGK